MAKLNKVQTNFLTTHEGGRASACSKEEQLRRSVLSCMLWEDGFYEDGVTIAERITQLASEVSPEKVARLAIEAREDMKLRHVPLLLVRVLAKRGFSGTADTLERVVQRADEMGEYLAIYWKDGKEKISAQSKKGLARCFYKFNEYNFAKYRKGSVSLRDVIRLVHPKARNEAENELFKRIASETLDTPDTWEISLSMGKDKRETFERLMSDGKLGGLALLRNLRNMIESSVSPELIKQSILGMKTERILPYRFISASKYAVRYEPELETKMLESLSDDEKLRGRTIVLVDVSGSMNDPLSAKSDITRIDAGNGLAMMAREICEDVGIYTFSNSLVEVAPRRGFALKDVIMRSQAHGGTELRKAISELNVKEKYDRLIIITDEQSHDGVCNHMGKYGYIINVASYQNGVGYGQFMHINGFSEKVLDYIRESER